MEQIIDLKKLYEELKRIERNMITKQELNSFIETLEIMNNEETLEQIKNSEEDIKAGRVREADSVDDI